MDVVPTKRGEVQSVAKAVALLHRFVADDEGKTLTELSRATGMHPSTALRLLRTLCATGMLTRAADSERYHRGPVFSALAQRSFVGSGMGELLARLEQLAADVGESVSLGGRDGYCAVVLMRAARAAGAVDVRIDRPVGTRVPLHASATGKALLAFGDRPLAAAVEELGVLEPVTSLTITAPERLLAELEQARAGGHAAVLEECAIGVRSVAVPVVDRDGATRLALAVDGPLATFAGDRVDATVIALRQAAEELSRSALLERFLAASPGWTT